MHNYCCAEQGNSLEVVDISCGLSGPLKAWLQFASTECFRECESSLCEVQLVKWLESFGGHFSDMPKASQCKLFNDTIDICVSSIDIFVFCRDTE